VGNKIEVRRECLVNCRRRRASRDGIATDKTFRIKN